MKNCIKLFLVMILLANFSVTGMAQSKPQRDVSKDRAGKMPQFQSRHDVANTRKNAIKKTQRVSLSSSKKQIADNKPKHTAVKRNVAYSNKQERTYNRSQHIKNNEKNLTVSSTNLMFDAHGDTKSIYVRTEDKSWYLTEVPYWCDVSYNRDLNSFSITCLRNETEKAKNADFYVHASNNMIRISVCQSGAPIVRPLIYNVTMQHNVKIGNEKYLVVSGTVDAPVSYERSFMIGAFFYDAHNKIVNVSFAYPSFEFADTNYLILSKTFVAKPAERYNYFSMYLPNNSMALSHGKQELTCKLNVYNPSDGKVVSSNEYIVRFHVKNKKGRIKTRKNLLYVKWHSF